MCFHLLLLLLLLLLFVVCVCLIEGASIPTPLTFGTGLASNILYNQPIDIFNHTLSPNASFGVMTHFWCAGDSNIDHAIWSYYIDDEFIPSLVFTSSMIAGTGFVDTQGPWGNKWFGKGAKDGAWYNNFRIPFHKSIRITGRCDAEFSGNKCAATVWVIVRGSEDLVTNFNGFILPPTAIMIQQTIRNANHSSLDWINIVDIPPSHPQSSGFLFSHTLSVAGQHAFFLEGCYHAFTPYSVEFPGMIVSTGTEDYFISAYYFDGGIFHLPNSGMTHWNQVNNSYTEVSAYRIHDLDPIFFKQGFRFVWRVGDEDDARGFKCITNSTNRYRKHPHSQAAPDAVVTSYAFIYVW